MTKICKNCQAEITGNYCAHCGQKSDTHRINFHFLWHDIQHGLFHVEKGILYTAKELFTRPGHSIREYLEGKRAQHFKPVSLVIVLAGIYGLLTHFFEINLLSNNIEVQGSGEELLRTKAKVESMSAWMSQHYSILALVQIPLFAIGTFLFFKKVAYNFIEHIVINAFIASQKLLVHLIAFPLFALLNHSSNLKLAARFTDGIGHLLALWTIYQLFSQYKQFERIWRILGSLLIPFLIFFLILLTIGKTLLT